MIGRQRFLLTLSAVFMVCLLGAQVAQAEETVTYHQIGATTTAFDDPNNYLQIGDPLNWDGQVPVPAVASHSGVTDFSATGLDLGTAGYWFFNFAAAANTGSAPEANEVEALPSWITVNKVSADPLVRTLSNGSVVHTSSGGQGWDTLTLPEASGPLTGVSGAVVVAGSAGNSSNAWQKMFTGAGTPAQFLMHVVVDNTNGTHDTDKRLKFRGKEENTREINMRLDNLTVDGSTDVYTFLMEGWGAGDELRMQVRNKSGFEFSSIAGIMFDVIPEPSSLALLVMGAMGLGGVRRRRR